ncbi:MAG: diacylglycerol kinase family lipid kinase [Bacteroidales bacterium]|nr:diacylglycerol kinase family lipid kinase [Bacteroidales bacterium]
MSSSRWMIILNPVAGGGRTAVMWPHISKHFLEHGLNFECVFTRHKYHAVTITLEAVQEGFRNFIVIGGDGTLHEVANGIFYQKDVSTQLITLGVIPIGTGNDFVRAYNIPTDYAQAMETILTNKAIFTDVGMVSFQDFGIERTRYFVNAAGMGLDAAVIRHYERQLEMANGKRKPQYMSSLLHQFLLYRSADLRILVDGNMFYEGPVLTCSVGMGTCIGNGMRALPLSIPDDGLFDITLVEPMSKVKLAVRIKDFVEGNVYAFKEAHHGRGKKIEVLPGTKRTTHLETDGELMGTPPYTFTILPSALKLLAGKDFVPHIRNVL